MTINIKGNDIEIKYSFKALMVYERITGKNFEPQGISDIILFFYSTTVANSKDFTLSFDDFVEELDENPQYLVEFSNYLTEYMTRTSQLREKDNGKKKKTKK